MSSVEKCAECLEQARLLGMSAEREARLRAYNQMLTKLIQRIHSEYRESGSISGMTQSSMDGVMTEWPWGDDVETPDVITRAEITASDREYVRSLERKVRDLEGQPLKASVQHRPELAKRGLCVCQRCSEKISQRQALDEQQITVYESDSYRGTCRHCGLLFGHHIIEDSAGRRNVCQRPSSPRNE